MWANECTTETDVPVDRIWRTFVDIHSGRLRLPGGDVFRPDGELAVGTRIAVTPAGQDTMTSVVTELEPGAAYADETRYGDLTLTFRHRFEPLEGATRITHTLTITGSGADEAGPVVGPQISADFPEQLDALVEAARRA